MKKQLELHFDTGKDSIFSQEKSPEHDINWVVEDMLRLDVSKFLKIDKEKHFEICWFIGDKMYSGWFDEKGKLHRTDKNGDIKVGFWKAIRISFNDLMRDLHLTKR